MKPWHALVFLALVLGFIEVYHITLGEHCPVVRDEDSY